MTALPISRWAAIRIVGTSVAAWYLTRCMGDSVDDATGQYPTLLQLDAKSAVFKLKIGRAPFFLCIYLFSPKDFTVRQLNLYYFTL